VHWKESFNVLELILRLLSPQNADAKDMIFAIRYDNLSTLKCEMQKAQNISTLSRKIFPCQTFQC